jgi:hypothetical protein
MTAVLVIVLPWSPVQRVYGRMLGKTAAAPAAADAPVQPAAPPTAG